MSVSGRRPDHDAVVAALTGSDGRLPEVREVPAQAAALDDALGAGAEGCRLVLDADLTGLSLALTRMRRAGTLFDLETAVLPRASVPGLRLRGVPDTLDAQLAAAVGPTVRTVGAIYDDSGGVCVDSAQLTPWRQTRGGWWVRSVVDDQRLTDGVVRSLDVTALGPDELSVTVRRGRFRSETARGRAVQLACDEAQIVTDGVGRENPRSKRTFWSEPKAWRLALPAE